MPSELDVLVIRKDSEQSHRDFRVRRSVVQEALTWLLENNRYYRANAIRLNEEALHRLPQDGNLTDMRSLQLGESSTYECEPSEDLYGAHFPLHLFLMLHSRGQSKRLCSSPFKTYRVDHLTPLCGPPLEEHRSMNSPLKDTLVWPSPPCFQQIINLQVKLTPYNLIYLAHARPKHVVHATSIYTEKISIRLTNVGLAQARPNDVIYACADVQDAGFFDGGV